MMGGMMERLITQLPMSLTALVYLEELGGRCIRHTIQNGFRRPNRLPTKKDPRTPENGGPGVVAPTKFPYSTFPQIPVSYQHCV